MKNLTLNVSQSFRQLGLLLIRFYTVRHYVCIFWTHNSIVMSPCLNFRVITEIFWGSQLFVFYGIHTGLYFDCSSSSGVSCILLRSQKTRKSVCYRKQDKSFTTNLERETKKYDMSLIIRKPIFGVFNQARFKPTCAATEAS